MTGWVQHWAGVYIDPTLPDYSEDIRGEQAYHMSKPGVNDILYNFLVCPNGQIFEGRGWDYKSGANGNSFWNAHGLAVQYHGGPSADGSKETPLTPEGRRALEWLYAEARSRYPQLTDIKAHSEVRDSPTACPGDVLRAFLTTLGETDMPLNIEDKNWLRLTIAEEITKANLDQNVWIGKELVKRIGQVADGALKTVYEAVRQANRATAV